MLIKDSQPCESPCSLGRAVPHLELCLLHFPKLITFLQFKDTGKVLCMLA